MEKQMYAGQCVEINKTYYIPKVCENEGRRQVGTGDKEKYVFRA